MTQPPCTKALVAGFLTVRLSRQGNFRWPCLAGRANEAGFLRPPQAR